MIIIVAGRVLFKSWLLAFGLVPFDRHALAFARVTPGSGFVEESTSWLQRRWRHERTLTERATDRCVVRDRLCVEPRIALTAPIVRAAVRAIFEHRHARLRTL